MNSFQQVLKEMVEDALYNWEFENVSDNIDGKQTKINLETILDNIENYDEYLVGDIVNNKDFDALEDYVLAYK